MHSAISHYRIQQSEYRPVHRLLIELNIFICVISPSFYNTKGVLSVVLPWAILGAGAEAKNDSQQIYV